MSQKKSYTIPLGRRAWRGWRRRRGEGGGGEGEGGLSGGGLGEGVISLITRLELLFYWKYENLFI